MRSLAIVALCIAAAVAFGILHDQITARICVEYFTVGHPPVFPTESPTLLGIGWGIIATWWVGLLLGVPLAVAARAGHRPKRGVRSLVRPFLGLLSVMGACAFLAGLAGFVLGERGAVHLLEPLASRVPQARHARFLADMWAHSASYFVGFVGGIAVIAWVWRSRGQPVMGDRNSRAALAKDLRRLRDGNMAAVSDPGHPTDPFDLDRFVKAQEGVYDRALAEIKAGDKRSHWMWYIFPQIDGLGFSSMAKRYAIKGLDEARAYLDHPVLGSRLRECAEAVLGVEGRSAHEIFGSPDDMKLRSCATLFAAASPPGSVFEKVLEAYYGGRRDVKTIQQLKALEG